VNEYAELRCVAVRWVSDEPQPGWVEVLLTDTDGRTWQFFDKPPIFDATGRLTSSSTFPAPVVMRVRVIEEGDPMTVSTHEPDGIASEEGQTVFRVAPSEVVR
jgi:hypothetical protein